MGYEPENRIGHLFGLGLWPLDENGMEQVPVLGRDEPDQETKRALRELCERWRDSRIKLKQAANCPHLDRDGKIGVGLSWALDADAAEAEAARLAMLSAGVILPGEPPPARGFAPFSIDVGHGWSVVVAPNAQGLVTGLDRPTVVFLSKTATGT